MLSTELAPFKNEAIKAFTDPAERAALEAAIARVRARLGAHHPLIIDGKPVATADSVRSVNPANPDETIGTVGSASLDQLNDAIEAATRAFETWRRRPVVERAELLVRAAGLIRERRDEFNALLILEGGEDRGARPTPIRPRRSTSSSTTRAKRCATTGLPPWSRSRARTTACATSRSGSAS